MALPQTTTPMGTTITFGTSGYSANVLGFGLDGIERTARDVTHLGTTGNRQYKPGSLVNRGTLSMRVQFRADMEPPINAAAETITIDFEGGGSPTATLSGTGFCTGYTVDAQGGDEEDMTAELTIMWDGSTGPTWS